MSLKEVFTNEYINGLQRISLRLYDKPKSGYAGIRKSAAKGQSLELSDFREYNPGDNISHIDWNSYSRLDKLVVKLFHEEKQAKFAFFIDTSKSMDFGKVNKLEFAKIFVASMAFIALNHGDTVTIYTENRVEKYLKRIQFNLLIQFLDEIATEGKTALGGQLKNFRKEAGDRNFICSDFFGQDGQDELLSGMKTLSGIHATALHCLCQEEIKPSFEQNNILFDSETSENLEIYISENNHVIENYEQALTEFCADLNSNCKKYGLDYNFISTDTNILSLILDLLKVR